MKSYAVKQSIFSIELKASKNKTTSPYKVEVVNNRAARRLDAKLAKQGKQDAARKEST